MSAVIVEDCAVVTDTPARRTHAPVVHVKGPALCIRHLVVVVVVVKDDDDDAMSSLSFLTQQQQHQW